MCIWGLILKYWKTQNNNVFKSVRVLLLIMWNSGDVQCKADLVLSVTVLSLAFISSLCPSSDAVFILLKQWYPLLGRRMSEWINEGQIVISKKLISWICQSKTLLFPNRQNWVPQPHETSKKTGNRNCIQGGSGPRWKPGTMEEK